MCVNFKQTFINYTKDGVLDKQELQALKQKAAEVKQADPNSEDSQIAENVLKNLEPVKDTTNMTYSLGQQGSSNGSIDLEFEFTPTYFEKEKVPGNNMREAISNISQSDSLKETKSDEFRCGAATLTNIALRSLADKDPGKSTEEIFASFAKKIGVPSAFTYENVHRAQDKLYTYANIDGQTDLSAEFNYHTDQSGKVVSANVSGEMKRLADYLGLKTQALLGPNKDNLNDKKAVIDNFFDKNPKGSVIVGVNLTNDGNLKPVDENNPQNHYVEIYKINNDFLMKDTGGVGNGNSSGSDVKLSSEKIKNELLFNNPGTTIGTTRP